MIIQKITLENFRCFYGKQELILSDKNHDEKPITLIHAENGVGKTTILNAFKWCFFNTTTERFEGKDELVNNSAQREGCTSTSIEVIFSHKDKEYKAVRKARINSKETSFDLVVLNPIKGETINEIKNPISFISSIIPEDMSDYFLVDGEHAEAFASESNTTRKDAIKAILGCKFVESGIDDLKDISTSFDKELSKNEKLGKKLNKIYGELAKFKSDLHLFEKDNNETKKKIEDHKQEIKACEVEIDKVKEAESLQENLSKEKTKQFDIKKELKKVATNIFQWLGKEGIFAISKPLFTKSTKFVEYEIQKGYIPAPYNEKFITDILEDNKCICGCNLENNNEARQNIKKLLWGAANAHATGVNIQVNALSGSLEQGHKTSFETLTKYKKDKDILEKEKDVIDQRINEINNKLLAINHDKVREHKEKLMKLQSEVETLEKSKDNFVKQIHLLSKEIADKEKAKLKEESKNKIVSKTITKNELTQELIKYLVRNLEKEEEQAKEIIMDFVSEIVKDVMRKNYSVEWGDNYQVIVKDEHGKKQNKSSGENQLLGISFTMALVKFAKLRENTNHQLLLRGAEAPLLLDSPFGALDEQYQEGVARYLYKSSSQVILLLSKSQATKHVLDNIKDHVGQEYVMVMHNEGEKPLEKSHQNEIVHDLSNSKHDITFFNENFQGTTIKAVNNG